MPAEIAENPESPPRPSVLPALVVAVIAAGHLTLLALAGMPGFRESLWGLHAWTFLDSTAWIGAGLAAALAGMLVLKPPRFPGFPAAPIAFGLLSIPFFFLFRDRGHFLGDGRLWISVLENSRAYHAHEPLSFAVACLTQLGRVEPGTEAVAFRAAMGSVALGFLAVCLAVVLVREAAQTPAGRWLGLGLLFGAGSIQFGFGYIEAYPFLWVIVLAFLVAGLKARAEGSLLPVAAAFGVGVAAHGTGVLLLPAMVVLFMARRPARRVLTASAIAAALPVIFAYGFLPNIMPSAGSDTAGVVSVWSGVSKITESLRFYPHGVPAWLMEQVNRWSLVAPLALGLAAVGWGAVRKEKVESSPAGPGSVLVDRTAVGFLFSAGLGLALLSLLLDTEGSRGASLDWDNAAVAGPAFAVLAAHLWDDRLRVGWVRAVLAVGLAGAVFGTLSFVLVNAAPPRAAERVEILARSARWSANSRGMAYETLAMFHRDAGDPSRAAEMYVEAAKHEPRNPRILTNAAILLARQGRGREALELYASAASAAPGDARVWYLYGRESSRAGQLDRAVTAFRRAVDVAPDFADAHTQLGRLLLTGEPGPVEREEALRLLQRSLILAPNQEDASRIRATIARLEKTQSD